MYIHRDEIKIALRELERIHPFFGVSFLAFKRLGVPVGRMTNAPIAQEEDAILRRYYSPAPSYSRYFIPFRTGSARKSRWVNNRYADTTLQRIRGDSFADALLHKKNSAKWGWRENYIEVLSGHLKNRKIPALSLAIWLYRDAEVPNASIAPKLIEQLFEGFRIAPEEQALFDTGTRDIRTSDEPPSWRDLQRLTGLPPGEVVEGGALLGELRVRGVGPAESIDIEPGERLSVVTGDNGLGKSFLLECVWFALTGSWSGEAVRPTINSSVGDVSIGFTLGSSGEPLESHVARYDWIQKQWGMNTSRGLLPGVVFFARADGSFSIWDPAKRAEDGKSVRVLRLSREDAWNGLRVIGANGKEQVLCSGLLADWTLWQSAPSRYPFAEFQAAIAKLSPPDFPSPISPGNPTRLPDDARDVPTLKHPYGEVPITQASAGIQRVVTMAYLLVWMWNEHRLAAAHSRRPAQEHVLVLIDEVEAHLHPRWQRTIVPALMATLNELQADVTLQAMIATHSPLVLASLEPVFDEVQDKLFHIDLDQEGDTEVRVAEIPFVKRGEADSWLRSEAFGLRHARSVESENAIEFAKSLQLQVNPSPTDVAEAHTRLVKHLASEDEFWPRWTFFARSKGIKA